MPRRIQCMHGFGAEATTRYCQSGRDEPIRHTPEDVIQRICNSKTTDALPGSDFGKLKAVGVSDRVLDYLQQSFVNDVDLLIRYWMQGGYLGGCSSCYPQPVDVDKLESGYSEVPTTPLGGYQLSRPMGTPARIPYPQRIPSAPPVSVSDIEEMTKDGVPQVQIIDRINRSPLTHVAGVGDSFTLHSHLVAGLSGSELARLHDAGVGYPVLDALQAQFLAQFIESDRLRYQGLGKKSLEIKRINLDDARSVPLAVPDLRFAARALAGKARWGTRASAGN